jgi:hypothetical protein
VGLLAGGNAVAVEAKATRAPRWHFAQQLGAPTLGKPAGVEWSALERVHHMGGLAVVVLDWGTHGTWVCTWMALEEVHGRGKSSAAPTEMPTLGARMHGAAWLDALTPVPLEGK